MWFSDPAYHWFREVFLEMAREADCQTFNCTEGGLLFGDGVITSTLDAFLETAGLEAGKDIMAKVLFVNPLMREEDDPRHVPTHGPPRRHRGGQGISAGVRPQRLAPSDAVIAQVLQADRWTWSRSAASPRPTDRSSRSWRCQGAGAAGAGGGGGGFLTSMPHEIMRFLLG